MYFTIAVAALANVSTLATTLAMALPLSGTQSAGTPITLLCCGLLDMFKSTNSLVKSKKEEYANLAIKIKELEKKNKGLVTKDSK
ncbi:hypothetical protein H4R33_004707 [Dimargaris cristalligena]|nr:hypothetical protein H4R33_004707 [Dimargaris cristalligena]